MLFILSSSSTKCQSRLTALVLMLPLWWQVVVPSTYMYVLFFLISFVITDLRNAFGSFSYTCQRCSLLSWLQFCWDECDFTRTHFHIKHSHEYLIGWNYQFTTLCSQMVRGQLFNGHHCFHNAYLLRYGIGGTNLMCPASQEWQAFLKYCSPIQCLHHLHLHVLEAIPRLGSHYFLFHHHFWEYELQIWQFQCVKSIFIQQTHIKNQLTILR